MLHVLHWNPLVVPPHVPVRYWLAGQLMLWHVLQRYEFRFLDTLHDPVRYWFVEQTSLRHLLHRSLGGLLIQDRPRCPEAGAGVKPEQQTS